MRSVLSIAVVALVTGVGGFLMGYSPSQSDGSLDSGLTLEKGSLLGSNIPLNALSPAERREAGHRVATMSQGGQDYTDEDFQNDLLRLGKSASPIGRFDSLTRMLENLSPENLPRVLKAFEKLPPTPEYINEYQMLLHAWTKFDRSGAIKFVENLVGDGAGGELTLSQEELLKPVLSSWASENPQKALEWFKYLPEDQQTHHMEMSLLAGWAVNDPGTAAEYLQSKKPGQKREYLIGQVVSELFRKSPQSAVEWAESSGGDWKFKEQVFEELAEDWVSNDPQGLADMLKGHVNERYSWEAVEDLGRGWVATDSDAATTWFEGLEDGPAKQKGIEKMAQSWAENDLTSMGEWLNSLPDSPTTDRGVKAYSERLAEQSPSLALDSAMGIQDDGIRNGTVQDIAQDWFAKDADSAIDWASSNNYPEEGLGRTLETYADMNSEQLREVTKQINRDQLPPEQMVELTATKEMLERQAQQLKQALAPAEGG